MAQASLSPPRTILVGVDGSEISLRAAGYAGMLGSCLDAEVLAVHAVGLMSTIAGEHHPSDSVRDLLAAELQRWCEPIAASGARYRALLEDGPPGLVLMRIAQREAVGLVVLGARGIGSAEGVMLGSTSHHLVQHCTVPVLVVPATAATT